MRECLRDVPGVMASEPAIPSWARSNPSPGPQTRAAKFYKKARTQHDLRRPQGDNASRRTRCAGHTPGSARERGRYPESVEGERNIAARTRW